jgi:phosphoserine phosphatase
MTPVPPDPGMIIWDFDGTLYPLCPYDSEQTLMRLRLDQLKGPHWRPQKCMLRMLIDADRRQWFTGGRTRKLYQRFYGRCLKGTPVPLLDKTAASIAAAVSRQDRDALHRLCGDGWRMVVVSCGTLDLSERILHKARIRSCFEAVYANQLRYENGRVAGIDSYLITSEDKLRLARRLAGGQVRGVVAVGDGYTDIPLLDWAETPVMMDPEGSKRQKYAGKRYSFAPSIEAVYKLLTDCRRHSMGRTRYSV